MSSLLLRRPQCVFILILISCPFVLGLLLLDHVHCAEIESSSPLSRIINGQVADFVPHACRVTGFSVDYSTEGSGTFVTQRHVVTAGSVIHNMMINYVYFGNTSMGSISTLSGLGFTHPDYDPETFENDIGIVLLGNLAAAAVPIALPLMEENTPLVDAVGTVSGFGLIEDETRGWTLNFVKQTGQFQVIDEESCRNDLGDRQELISSTHFCTDNEARLCFGDIGGGLTLNIDGKETLVGVVSVITNMCHHTYPAMYTRVARYTEWIQENVILDF